MINEVLAYITSFIAVGFVVTAYFVKKRSLYLLFQSLNLFCLVLSYLFSGEFFVMVGLSVSLIRTVTFFAYEEKQKEAPLILAIVFASLTVAAYFIVNLWILKTAKPLDILCLVALVMYSFIFKIQNLKTVRFCMLLPLSISIVYNLFSAATVFVVLSYAIELLADILSICKYHLLLNRKRINTFKKEKSGL